jgi:5,6,7,8-tetrahydromethanopterin hydro-lyase
MLFIGESLVGAGINAAHINLYLGHKDGPIASAFAVAAASPGVGHVPFQAVLKPNLPAKPITLFIAKAVLRSTSHETMTWGPAQLGVAAGVTKALLDGILPQEAEDDWLAIACVWLSHEADDAEEVYHNNRVATFEAAKRALQKGWPNHAELSDGLSSVGNPFFTPKVAYKP